jgi:hypothetical protein
VAQARHIGCLIAGNGIAHSTKADGVNRRAPATTDALQTERSAVSLYRVDIWREHREAALPGNLRAIPEEMLP